MAPGSFDVDVLIIVSSDPRYDTRSTKFLKTLSESGYKAKLVGVCSEGEPERTDTLVRIPVNSKSGKKFFIDFYRNVIPEARATSAKLIIAGDLFSLPPAIIGKRRYSTATNPVRLIYDSKELYRELPSLKVKKTSFMFWSLVEASAIRYVDAAFTVNKSIGEILGTRWDVPFTVIRNVPDKAPKPGLTKSFDKITLAFSGGLQPGRGLPSLVKLLTLLPEKYELEFIGDGALKDELSQLSTSFRVSNRVRFLGRVPSAEVVPELSKAHLGIYLMENSGLCHYLALPNKFFQFITARLPVIVPGFPEMERIVNEYGIGAAVDTDDLNSVAKRVIEFTGDPATYEKLTVNCERAASELNWDAEKQSFLKAVGKLI